MSTAEDPKPKSKINGKRTPEYKAWWDRNNRDKTKKYNAKCRAKRTGKAKKKKASIKAGTTQRRAIIAMHERGRSHTTIAVVLCVPISAIIKVLNDHKTKP